MDPLNDLDWHDAAQGFDALGATARLQIIRLLVRHGGEPLTISTIKKETGIAASTLAHHLNALRLADLIAQEKSGRETMTRANLPALEALAQFILDQCCVDTAKAEGPTG